jgi:aryl-alcohol dehydrogenase-like predicted oxidoreductase
MNPRLSRRAFVKTSVLASAGAAAASSGWAAETPPAKILNANPKMGYRRLGKTGFMVSEVSLGGHGAGWKHLEHAVELGINYVDTNMTSECRQYGEAMAKSSAAKRNTWFIGFGSWPEKITEDGEKGLTADGMTKAIEDRLKDYKTDCLDLWRPVGATWGPGQNAIPTLLMISEKTLDLVAGVYEKAKQQGKVRHLGVSAHNPKVFRRVLEKYPQFSVIIFPYLFLTKELGGDSLLKLAQEKDVGVIGLKPFGAGNTFGLKKEQAEHFTDKRAHAMVKEMLKEKRLSAVIPGIGRAEHLDENVRGSYERDVPATPDDKKALREFERNFYANLPPHYQWLHQWTTV